MSPPMSIGLSFSLTGGGDGGGVLLPQDAHIVFLGDSITNFGSMRNFKDLVRLKSAPLFAGPGSNLGVSSETVDDFLLRVDDVPRSLPDVVVIHGGINNIGSVDTNINTGAHILSVLAQIRAAIWTALPSCKIVQCTTIPNATIANNSNASQVAQYNILNTGILALAGSDPRLIIADCAQGYDGRDANASFQNGYNFDGTHPHFVGANHMATAIAAALEPYIRDFDVLTEALATNLAPNPSFSGSVAATSPATGVRPTSYGLTVPSGAFGPTVVGSKGTRVDEWGNTYETLIIEVQGTASGAGSVQVGASIVDTFNLGDNVETLMHAKITAADGVNAPAGLMAFGTQATAAGSFMSNTLDSSSGPVTVPLEGLMRLQMGSGLLADTGSISWQTVFTFAAGTVDCRIELSAPRARRYPRELTAYAPAYKSSAPAFTGSTTAGTTQTMSSPGGGYGGGLTWSIQWYKDGVAIPGATGPTVSRPSGSGSVLTVGVKVTNTLNPSGHERVSAGSTTA